MDLERRRDRIPPQAHAPRLTSVPRASSPVIHQPPRRAIVTDDPAIIAGLGDVESRLGIYYLREYPGASDPGDVGPTLFANARLIAAVYARGVGLLRDAGPGVAVDRLAFKLARRWGGRGGGPPRPE